jgi:cobalt-zinc-cadmium efflux system outer membrane protein
MTGLMNLRSAAASLLAASAVALAACVSAPPAPIDAAATAKRLTARSLEDPRVVQALAKAGLPTPTQGKWNLDALTVAAWTLRPDIAVAAADVAAGNAAQRVAGQLPNPSLALGPGYTIRNANSNVSPWTMATSVGFTIETAGKRRIRSAQARAATQTLRWQFAETLWRARQEVRKALLSRQLAQLSLTLAEREVALRESFNAWVDTQIRFGAAAQPDRLAAQTSLAQAQGQLRTAQGELAAAEADLAASLGIVGENLPLAQVVPVAIDILPDPAATPPGIWRQWSVTNRLSVNHALADYEVAEQDLRMAVAKQYPDISFGPGYSYDKGDGVITLALGLTLPLFHGERAQINAAMAVRQKAAMQFEAIQAQALAEVDTALARYRAAYAALAQTRDAEAATTSAAASVERRLRMGAADRGELLTGQLAAVIGRRATLEALRTALSAFDAIENSVQRPVWPASSLALEHLDTQAGS